MLTAAWTKQLPLQHITAITPVGGGDVNQAYRVDTAEKPYFLLVQPGYPASFYAGEIAGLKSFEQADILAPRVIANGTIEGDGYLLLSFLTSGSGSQRDLGHLVAHLHQHHEPSGRFGFDYPYAGTSVSFANDWTDSWADLFIHQRLDKLSAHLRQKGLWQAADQTTFQQVRTIIQKTLNQHHSEASLLHGDLWGGNYMFTADGQPALIDPAALYGDRELDIGVTTVFGGFTQDFYTGYQEVYPLDPGYQFRLEFYRLYYLMVHLDKFGMGYAGSVAAVMDRILDHGLA